MSYGLNLFAPTTYGLNAYRSGYLGNVLELWTPSDLSGVIEWWDHETGITTATGVSSWAGVLGNLNATQATASRQPAYDTSGIPKLVGDGVDDRLEFNAATLPYGADPLTVFSISRSRTTSDALGSVTGYGKASNAGGMVLRHIQDRGTLQFSDFNYATQDNIPDELTVLVGRSFSSVGVAPTLNVSGSKYTGTNTQSKNTVNNSDKGFIFGRNLFGDRYLDGDLYAVGYVSEAVSDADAQRIEGWAAHKMNDLGDATILNRLAADHPYKTEAPTK